MEKTGRILCRGFAIAGGFILAMIAAGHLALADVTFDPKAACSLSLHYMDSIDGDDPIVGAEFTYYRVATVSQEVIGENVGLLWRSVFSINGKKNTPISASVTAADLEELTVRAYQSGQPEEGVMGTIRTDQGGNASVTGLPQGLYLIRETRCVPDHLASSPFLLGLPYVQETGRRKKRTSWSCDAYAEPKARPCGTLVIEKQLRGSNAGSAEEFHFGIALGAEGEFPAETSDGRTLRVKNGDSVVLKGGQSIRIRGIPAGTGYKVAEQEANQNGYRTYASGISGTIRRLTAAKALFINERTGAAPTPTPRITTTTEVPGTTTSKSQTVKTGDMQKPGFWIGILLASAFGICLIILQMGRGGRE